MSRVCDLTGKRPAVANNVSHAMNKTKRRQLPNLQNKQYQSEILGRTVALRVSTKAMRTIDKHGGLDPFMLNYKSWDDFSPKALKLRKEIRKASTSQATVA